MHQRPWHGRVTYRCSKIGVINIIPSLEIYSYRETITLTFQTVIVSIFLSHLLNSNRFVHLNSWGSGSFRLSLYPDIGNIGADDRSSQHGASAPVLELNRRHKRWGVNPGRKVRIIIISANRSSDIIRSHTSCRAGICDDEKLLGYIILVIDGLSLFVIEGTGGTNSDV